VGDALKLAVKLADAGFKTVDGIIKRLPGR
jgi:hypothetical protein